MKRILTLVFASVFLYSCFPVRIAPSIDDYKITKGKKFKRSLPKRQMFVFEDSKDAGEFYNYVNQKFDLNHEQVYDDVPFMANDEQYFFSFYEVTIPNKAVNLFPVIAEGLIDAALGIDDGVESEPEEIRQDNFYIAIEVYSDLEKDCLADGALSRAVVLKYLRALKNEYLFTGNYNGLLFRN